MSRVKTSVLLLLSIVFLSANAQEKATLHGTIKDESGNPLSNVLIAVENSSHGTYSDAEGYFSLLLPNGQYVISVSLYGYNTIRKKLNIRGDKTFDVILKENSVALEVVRVFGKTKTRQLKESAYSVNSIDVRLHAGASNTLRSIINRTSGVRVREKGGVGSEYNLSIHGLSGNAVRYFIDGVPLSTLGNSITLNNIPVNIVDRVEIYKGVAPASIGGDALGGVINIITRRNRNNFIDIDVGGGSFHTYKANINAQYIHPTTRLTIRPLLALNYSKNNYTMRGVEVWNEDTHQFESADMKRFHDGYQSAMARIDVGFTDCDWADEAFVSATVSAETKELQTGRKQSVVIGEAQRDRKSLSLAARYIKRDFLTENLTARFYLSHTSSHTQVVDTAFRAYSWDGSWLPTSFSEVSGRGKSIRHYTRPQTVARAYLNYSINDSHALHFNYLLNSLGNRRYDDFDPLFISTNDRLDKHIFGLSYNQQLLDNRLQSVFFVKDYLYHTELQQTDLYWITGIRDVNPSATKNSLGYGVGGRYAFSRALAVKASYERAVRLPSSIEFLGNGETVYPNFALKPEMAHNVNIGIFGTWQTNRRHSLLYESNLFMRRVKNYILKTPVNERQSQYDNVGSATVKGVEAEVEYRYGSIFRALLNGTYLNERNTTKHLANGDIDITYNNRLPNRPWLFANAEINCNIKNPFGQKATSVAVEYVFRYVHWFYLTWEAYGNKDGKAVIPSQYINDAAVTYSFSNGKYALSLQCENIFNRTLYDNYMLQKPGRTFFFKTKIFIN